MDKLICQMEQNREDTCHKVNQMLHTPIDFSSTNELAYKLFENGIYPQEITLDYFKEHRYELPIYEHLYEWKKICQKITLYKNLKKKKCNDNRLRGIWQIDSSSTKRLGCKEPNLMSLPGDVKKCVIPETGNVIIKCDFSQIELRILAELSKDKNLIYAFNNDNDIHKYTASLIFNKKIDSITEEERSVCKAINFGLIYGMSALTLMEKLHKINFKCSLSYATNLRNNFFDVFPNIKKHQGILATSSLLRSLGGSQISTDKLTVNQRLNWPIQTSCSEILLESLDILMKNKMKGTKLINCIHDEIWLETNIENMEIEMNTLVSSMCSGFEKYIKLVPCKIDSEVIEGS